MDKRKRILELMPLIEEISDEGLKKGVVDVWVQAWEDSKWEDVADCFFNVKVAHCSLIQHTNFVAMAAKAMADYTRAIWGTEINDNLLIAAAILHDVCKVVEHAPAEGKTGKDSAIGEALVHGTYGVHLALNAGLPLDVISIISLHTPQVKKKPNNLEGSFICYADLATADMFIRGTDRIPYLERIG